jgi:hypothetical protein
VPASPSIASSRSARRQTDKWQNLRVVAARGTQGTSIRSLMRNLGGSIGISILVATLAENTQVVHSRLVEGLRLNNPLAQAPFWRHRSPEKLWVTAPPASFRNSDRDRVVHGARAASPNGWCRQHQEPGPAGNGSGRYKKSALTRRR